MAIERLSALSKKDRNTLAKFVQAITKKENPISTTTYRITSQRQLRAEFWKTFPGLSRRKIADYSGNGKMHTTDTRCAFVDWVDMLSKDGI